MSDYRFIPTWAAWRAYVRERGGFASPLTILRRLTAYPFVQLFRALLFVALLIGWGLDDARRNWEDFGT